MTTYAGTTVQVLITAKDFNSKPFTGVDVTVHVTIFDTDGITPLVDDQLVGYNTDELGWVYMWDTTNVPVGAYKGKATAVDLLGDTVWGFFRVRLRPNVVPVA